MKERDGEIDGKEIGRKRGIDGDGRRERERHWETEKERERKREIGMVGRGGEERGRDEMKRKIGLERRKEREGE
jgi:hypothetical protein